MKLVGLTGTTGSGKGYVSSLFAAEGIRSIDTDAIVHGLYRENEACKCELMQVFGSILNEEGSVDRKKLAAIVFSDKEKLALLNSIVHRYVKDAVEEICQVRAAEGDSVLLLDAPQLFESGMENMCYCVVAVIAPTELRLERICARDSIDRMAAEARIRNQHSDGFFETHADYVIYNDGNQSLENEVKRIIGELKYGKKETE